MKKLTSITAFKRYSFMLIVFISFCCTSSGDKTPSSDSTATLVQTAKGGNPLPSWNDGEVKKELIDYVTNAAKEGNSGFVAANGPHCCF
jgi:hypothetical protein